MAYMLHPIPSRNIANYGYDPEHPLRTGGDLEYLAYWLREAGEAMERHGPMFYLPSDGIPVPEEMYPRLPHTVYVKRFKRYYPLLMGADCCELGNAAYEAVERVDPGVHQWLPLRVVVRKSGRELGPEQDAPYRIWNIQNRVKPWELFDYDAMRGTAPVIESGHNGLPTDVGSPFETVKKTRRDQGGVGKITEVYRNGIVSNRIDVVANDERIVIRSSALLRANAVFCKREVDQNNCTHNPNFLPVFFSDRLGEELAEVGWEFYRFTKIRET
jgi:hypothetical protein